MKANGWAAYPSSQVPIRVRREPFPTSIVFGSFVKLDQMDFTTLFSDSKRAFAPSWLIMMDANSCSVVMMCSVSSSAKSGSF